MIREGQFLITWEDEYGFKHLKTSVRLKYYQFVIVFPAKGVPKIYDVKNGKFLHISPSGHIHFSENHELNTNRWVCISHRGAYNYFAPQNKSFLLENFT